MLAPPALEPALPGLRRAIKQGLYSVGYYHHNLRQSAFPGVAILCYHSVRGDAPTTPFHELHVTSDTFERHCRLVAEVCDPISLDDLRAARAGTRSLPSRPVLVTFDDGYRGVLEHALPSLERHKIPATVFACAGPILRTQHFWFDAVWRRDGQQIAADARRIGFDGWRELERGSRTTAHAFEEHRPLAIAELRQLAAHPLIEIGGHTLTHPTLAIAPLEEQRNEIAGCRQALAELLGTSIRSFAYPYGSAASDYSAASVKAVRDAGFDVACTTDSGFATLTCDPLQMPRFVMLESVGEVELAHRFLHSWRSAEARA
jgi:peptidoglycan/xylan/chitin deacetylase (PgdA/CDA1 family)